MTDTQLDPEMELEAQQLACYEDEMRDLAEEVNTQDEYFEEHKEEFIEWQKKMDEEMAQEFSDEDAYYLARSKKWEVIWFYTLKDFRHIRLPRMVLPDEEEEDDWSKIVDSIMYGSLWWAFQIDMDQHSDWDVTLCIRFKYDWYDMNIWKHNLKSYEHWIAALNNIAPLFCKIVRWNM